MRRSARFLRRYAVNRNVEGFVSVSWWLDKAVLGSSDFSILDNNDANCARCVF